MVADRIILGFEIVFICDDGGIILGFEIVFICDDGGFDKIGEDESY